LLIYALSTLMVALLMIVEMIMGRRNRRQRL